MRLALVTSCLIAVAATLVLTGCGAANTDASATPEGKAKANAVEVPNLIGMRYRPTQELLAKLGLRWGDIGTSSWVQSEPPADNVASSGDDDFVTEQNPSAGTTVERGAIIRLRTSCVMRKLQPGELCID
jgi:beta-lactam-binding protein with PASTA domain